MTNERVISADDQVLPMFPLGSVLFPGLGLPLRVFEPRYRQLVADCLDGDRQFGVVLIERGSEVGGGDQRLSLATVARIIDVVAQPDGTLGVFAVGEERAEVVAWLPDDPYPQARLRVIADPALLSAEEDRVGEVVRRLRAVLAQRNEANLAAAPATIELSTDPAVALWQVCALTPATPLDDYELLAAASIDARIEILGRLFEASNDAVRFHLS